MYFNIGINAYNHEDFNESEEFINKSLRIEGFYEYSENKKYIKLFFLENAFEKVVKGQKAIKIMIL